MSEENLKAPQKIDWKSPLKFPRYGHSITCIRDKFLLVIGSRFNLHQADQSVECYNIEFNIWFEQPSLNIGRHFHSSCLFDRRWVYVFGGLDCT